MGERPTAPPEPFRVRDCALVAIATGVSVRTLREIREALREAHPESIYYHFWGRLLQSQFDDPEYNNDFASWASHALHDKTLAERLSVINPIQFSRVEDLRQGLIDVMELRLDESEVMHRVTADQPFHFTRAQIVVFDTGRRVREPASLARATPALSDGSIFYHFIDARRRTPDRSDDFSSWLAGYGETYAQVIARLRAIDPYFSSLKGNRQILVELFRECFSKKRNADNPAQPAGRPSSTAKGRRR